MSMWTILRRRVGPVTHASWGVAIAGVGRSISAAGIVIEAARAPSYFVSTPATSAEDRSSPSDCPGVETPGRCVCQELYHMAVQMCTDEPQAGARAMRGHAYPCVARSDRRH